MTNARFHEIESRVARSMAAMPGYLGEASRDLRELVPEVARLRAEVERLTPTPLVVEMAEAVACLESSLAEDQVIIERLTRERDESASTAIATLEHEASAREYYLIEMHNRVQQAEADKADQMRLADEHIVLFDEAEAEVERLTRELDDARRDLCQVYGRNECGQRWPSKTVEDAAARRVATRNGWGYLYVDEGTSSPRVDPEIIP